MAPSEKLKRLFPHASKAFLSANPDLDAKLQSPKLKQAQQAALDRVLPGKEKGHGRTHLCITSFVVRLRDEDNLKGGCKALIDCIKALRLIDDDDPQSLELEVKQVKVHKRKAERTIVQITYESLENTDT